MNITVKKPTLSELKTLNVTSWPVWEKEVSTFPWEYEEKETCYILEGLATVTPVDPPGEPVTFGRGDLVTFPEGLHCSWKIRQKLKKHYRFG